MARKAYKRRRTSKRSSKKKVYKKRRTSYKKAKTRIGKVWKYLKKATKSEVKRCDALFPANISYGTSLLGSELLSPFFYSDSRYLYTINFKNNGVAYDANFLDTSGAEPVPKFPWAYTATWRFWSAYQLDMQIPIGPLFCNRIGEKVFAKYINFKIQFHGVPVDDADFGGAELYFVRIQRSVSASYTNNNIYRAIWYGVPFFEPVAAGHDIYRSNALMYAATSEMMAKAFHTKRRKYLKGVTVKKLHSWHPTRSVGAQTFPAYTVITGGNVPTKTYSERLATLNYKNQNIEKVVTLNTEWKYDMKAESSGEDSAYRNDEYKYYLIAIGSHYEVNKNDGQGAQTVIATPTLEYKVSAELVFTDK